ncbi:MAG TPA: MazG family protein [Mycobacteriales bacterium]|nr:MazG family protein [Mycobacteriales bacterium]
MTDRLLLVTTSPRLPAGLLSWAGWEALRSGPVYAADPGSAQAQAVRASGVAVSGLSTVDDVLAGGGPGRVAYDLRERARAGGVAVWLAGPDGDPELARALGDLVARSGGAELEVVYGSWDPPGARLLDVVAVMDRLRSPGGCPWDAEQTHTSLAPYLLEETYEAYEALEHDDPDALREELGDVLLQVVFHARLAEELPEDERWSIDDVAGHLVDKLVRRHPHVFAGLEVSDAAEVHANWDKIKRAEKPRGSVTDGVPMGQPALTLAAALQRKAARIGLADVLPDPAAAGAPAPELGGPEPSGPMVGRRLWALVAEARAAGLDAEAELRAVARAYRAAVIAAERVGPP